MAMTKKERAEFDAALKQARIMGALRFTSEVLPDVVPPKGSCELSKGFLFSAGYMKVVPACSNSVNHAHGRSDRTTTQGPRYLFSTQLLALKAMRNAIEYEAAEKLAKIDEFIAAMSAAEGEPK